MVRLVRHSPIATSDHSLLGFDDRRDLREHLISRDRGL
jgi:hypothetical protein